VRGKQRGGLGKERKALRKLKMSCNRVTPKSGENWEERKKKLQSQCAERGKKEKKKNERGNRIFFDSPSGSGFFEEPVFQGPQGGGGGHGTSKNRREQRGLHHNTQQQSLYTVFSWDDDSAFFMWGGAGSVRSNFERAVGNIKKSLELGKKERDKSDPAISTLGGEEEASSRRKVTSGGKEKGEQVSQRSGGRELEKSAKRGRTRSGGMGKGWVKLTKGRKEKSRIRESVRGWHEEPTRTLKRASARIEETIWPKVDAKKPKNSKKEGGRMN